MDKIANFVIGMLALTGAISIGFIIWALFAVQVYY